MAIAVLGGGCFWCLEAVFQRIKGVQSVVSGYMGGDEATADYKTVCSGATEHVEVVQVEFDEAVLSFSDLLDVFFVAHDPTTLNRQGNDIGTQYRSVIFYQDEAQQAQAEAVIAAYNAKLGGKVVTALEQAEPFYRAENYHQNYYNLNSQQSYCSIVILEKLRKLGML